MLAIILIVTGVLFRFIPHAPNFSPVAAIALFGAAHLPNKKLALLIPLTLMMLSDLFLGLHSVILFTWGSVVLISCIGLAVRKKNKLSIVLMGSLASSFLFFIVTNFGVWLTGWYPQTAAGLTQCFVAAIPFFRNTLASTLLYSGALFGSYALAAKMIRNTKLAGALLTKA